MSKILGIVEQLMQMHINALKEMGVDLEAQAKDMADKGTTPVGTDKPIDDLLD